MKNLFMQKNMSTNIIIKALQQDTAHKETPVSLIGQAECKTCLYNSMNLNNYSLSDLVKLSCQVLNWMLLKEGVNKGVSPPGLLSQADVRAERGVPGQKVDQYKYTK
jgi:hypothetical protein